jgi:anti-sigma-K factor RskA
MTDDREYPEPASLAAEYALGLLAGDRLRDARALERSDSDFAAEVARWRGRFTPLHSETQEIAPPADLWSRIEAATLDHTSANDNVQVLRRRLRIWRSAAGGFAAVAACLALVLVFEPKTRVAPLSQLHAPTSATPLVALLGDKGAMKVVASWDPAARQLIIAVPGDLPSSPAHSNQLWVIPPDGKPRSLGTMQSDRQMHVRLADALARLLQQGATIAISVEPPGGSPTGAPTGPVVASGALNRA